MTLDREEAERIVDGILYDLCDRRGIRQAIEGCDADIRLEIREALIGIAMRGGDGKRPWWTRTGEE